MKKTHQQPKHDYRKAKPSIETINLPDHFSNLAQWVKSQKLQGVLDKHPQAEVFFDLENKWCYALPKGGIEIQKVNLAYLYYEAPPAHSRFLELQEKVGKMEKKEVIKKQDLDDL